MRTAHSARLALTVLWLAAITAACDSASDQPAATGASRRAAGSQASQLAASMVSAVSGDTSKSSIDVRFGLTQRPEVGKPTDISLVFLPVSPLERLYARFSAVDGVDVVKGEQTAQFTRPVVGVALEHTVTIVPRRDGIFTVQAVVLMDSEKESISRVFSIPVIAGSGIPEWSARKGATQGDDAG